MPLTEVGRQWRGLTEYKKVKYLEMGNMYKEQYVRRWRSTLPRKIKKRMKYGRFILVKECLLVA